MTKEVKKIMEDAISGQMLLEKRRCKHSIKIVQNMCSTNELTSSSWTQNILDLLDFASKLEQRTDFSTALLKVEH